jgi:hypothetical protein
VSALCTMEFNIPARFFLFALANLQDVTENVKHYRAGAKMNNKSDKSLVVQPSMNANSLSRGAIHQLLSIILQLRILFLLPVSTLPFVVIVKNYS